MNLLILGGTLFLGRHLIAAAQARGHRVTLFNRGSDRSTDADVERLRGDRDGGLAALDGRRWDAVIDTSGYVPRLVRASAERLADAADHYTFVSSASVYADMDADRIDERAAVAALEDPRTEDVAAHYAALKAACERAADDAMPGRVLHVRAGLLVGPYDPTGRFEYWVRRLADGGDVLAPGDPGRPVQAIDARDVADWIVARAEAGTTGVFNATASMGSMADVLDACRTAAAADLEWVDDAFLLGHDVAPFSEMPLWLPRVWRGLMSLDVSRAAAAGLTARPIAETIDDTRRWLEAERASGAVRPARLASGVATGAGLDRARERALLAAWRRDARAA